MIQLTLSAAEPAHASGQLTLAREADPVIMAPDNGTYQASQAYEWHSATTWAARSAEPYPRLAAGRFLLYWSYLPQAVILPLHCQGNRVLTAEDS